MDRLGCHAGRSAEGCECRALRGEPKESLLSALYVPSDGHVHDLWAAEAALCPEVEVRRCNVTRLLIAQQHESSMNASLKNTYY